MSQDFSPERWQRLEELFTAASDLAGDEQRAFIDRETADEIGLRRELEGMLAHRAGAGERIAQVVTAVAETAASAGWIGRQLGPYRIVREIGHGGMGIVFEAIREDEYRQRVALKLAPWSRDVAALGERFRQERQILAALEHPNIARLLDGGTADGTPYFVMEFVEGVPITEYCERHRLDLRERLALIQLVAGAVRAAHERLIVHRDLKPANILVANDGVPKLLDFGIAKLLGPVGNTSSTSTLVSMWTPDYTSPEQVRGEPVTTRTDVYSLGLVLYELLAGERAQVADTSSPLALDASICDVEPPRPSDRAAERGDRALARRLRGDLDTIVMTAISKESARRYESVIALSEDIARYLDGRTVRARPNTVGYRTWKTIRRHRLAVGAAAIVIASLVTGAAVAFYQAQRAERRFQQVRNLANAFVFDVHDRIQYLPGATEARRAIVQTALTYLENLAADAGSDPELAVELATAYEKVGNVQGNPLGSNLGDMAGALSSFDRATQILQPFAARGHRGARLHLASAVHNRAIVRRARGEASFAEDFEHARGLAERLLAESPSDPEILIVAGNILSNAARAAHELREYARAEQLAKRAMEIATALLSLDPKNGEHRLNLSTAHNTLGTTRIAAGRIEEAAASFRRSIEIREQLVREDPDNAEYRRNLLISYGTLGDVLGYRPGENLGDPAGAVSAYTRAIELATWAKERDAADRRALFDLANAELRLGTILVDNPNEVATAVRHLGEAERLTDALLAQEPGSDRYRYIATVINRRTGEALVAAGKLGEAKRRFMAARAGAEKLSSGAYTANAFEQRVLSTIALAQLAARTGDMGAVSLADEAAKGLAERRFTGSEPTALADLGRVYLELARRSTGPVRADHVRAATSLLERSASLWREAKLPSALEARRARELAALEKDLKECGMELGATPRTN